MKLKQLAFPTEIITVKEEEVKLFEEKKDLDEFLVQIDPFIIAEVEKCGRCLPEQKRDVIKQNVRIKLWHALEVRAIRYPRAYIRTIIKNALNDLGRECKPPEQLPLDDYGEVSQGIVLVYLSEGWGNPEQVVVQREDMDNRLDMASEAMLVLPPRQQLAMVCSLIKRVDDIVQLKNAFGLHQVPIEMEDWPDDVVDAQRLKALISVARHKIARFMEDNAQISRRDVSTTSLLFDEKAVKS